MSTEPDVRPAEPDDWPRISDLRHAAFRWRGVPESLLDGMWVLLVNGNVQACARLEPEGQWFGGWVVPTGLVSSVAVAPEARGRGSGSRLLRAILGHARDAGLAAITLYPSAIHPYRRAGFEIAGVSVTLAVDARDLASDSSGDLARLDDVDLPDVMACYDRVAATLDGAIARSERWWRQRILAARPPTPLEDPDVYAFVSRSEGRVQGSMVYTLLPAGADAYGMRVVCRDLTWEDEASARGLLGLVAGGRPILTGMEWHGAAVDPLSHLLAAEPRIAESTPWMHRVIDPVGAIAARGFPPTVRADVTLRVHDPSEPAWSTGLRARIADGRAEVTQEHVPGPDIDVGTLSAVLAGALHPRAAARLGRLRAEPAELDALGALYPAGQRWMGDRF